MATWRDRAKAAIVFWLMAGATYFFIPRIIFFQPETVPFVGLDHKIPFVCWSVLIYLSLYFQVTIVFFLSRNSQVLKRLFWAYMTGGALLGLFYLLVPTIHNYPNPVADRADFPALLVLWLRHADVPANQFPSGHAMFSILGPAVLLSSGRYWRGGTFMLWGALISVSALTVKQHNFYDVAAGAAIAMAIGYLFGESCPRPIKKITSRPSSVGSPVST